MNKEKYWIWLSRLGNEIEPIVLKKLLDEYKMPDKIWKLTKTKLKKFGIKQEHLDVILNKKYKEQFCLELFQQVFVPLHSFATYGQVWHGQDTSFTYWGDASCKSKNQKCLSNISLDDIYQACHSCATISEAYCNVNLSF